MRHTRKNGLIMTLIAIFAIMAMGTTAVAAGIGGAGTDLPFFAQNGNGGRSGENPPHRPGTGNDGQGQGVEHGNPPADPGSGNNRQGGQEDDEGEDEVLVPADTEDTGDEAIDNTVETEAEDTDAEVAPVNPAPEKLEVCHLTGNGGVLISISSRAVPAHMRHGDTAIGDTAEAACADTAEAENAALAPDASPAAGETDDVDAMEAGTPAASPMASPEPDND